jgi:hypothetical protein
VYAGYGWEATLALGAALPTLALLYQAGEYLGRSRVTGVARSL